VKKLLTAVCVLLLCAGLLPGLMGYQLEQVFDDELLLLGSGTEEFVTVDEISYQRGWFSSRVEIRLSLSDAYRETLLPLDDSEADEWVEMLGEQIIVRIDVAHGPLLPESNSLLGLGFSKSELQPGSAALSDLVERLEIPHLMEVRVHTGFTGNSVYTGSVPALTYDASGNVLNFSGMEFSGHAHPAQEQVAFDALISSISIETLSGDILVKNIAYDFALQRLAGEFWMGPGEMSVETVFLGDALDAEVFAIDELVVSVDNALDEASNQMNISLLYSIDEIRSDPGLNLKNSRFGVELKQLDIDALTSLYELNQRIAAGEEVGPEQLREPVYSLVAGSPHMSLNPFTAVVNGEPFSAEFDFRLDGSALPESESFDPMSESLWNDLLSGDARMTFSESLANTMAGEIALSQLEEGLGDAANQIDPAELQKLAQQQGIVLVQALEQQGMIKAIDSGYESEISFRNGQVLMNGVVIPTGTL